MPAQKIKEYMSTKIHSIGLDQPLAKAQEMMRKFSVRHLPVMEGNRLVGIISDRDIKLALSLVSGSRLEQQDWIVEEAFIDDPFSVDTTTPLKEVVSQMAERRIGSVLVTESNKPVGIFTTTDLCKAYVDLAS